MIHPGVLSIYHGNNQNILCGGLQKLRNGLGRCCGNGFRNSRLRAVRYICLCTWHICTGHYLGFCGSSSLQGNGIAVFIGYQISVFVRHHRLRYGGLGLLLLDHIPDAFCNCGYGFHRIRLRGGCILLLIEPAQRDPQDSQQQNQKNCNGSINYIFQIVLLFLGRLAFVWILHVSKGIVFNGILPVFIGQVGVDFGGGDALMPQDFL